MIILNWFLKPRLSYADCMWGGISVGSAYHFGEWAILIFVAGVFVNVTAKCLLNGDFK